VGRVSGIGRTFHQLDPTEPWPGGTLTVSGSGWETGAEVSVGFIGFNPITFVDDNGNLSVVIAIPEDTPSSQQMKPGVKYTARCVRRA
jgi:hypothetical protein